MKKSDQRLILVYFLTDIILLNGSFVVSLFLKYGRIPLETRYKTLFILFNVIWLLVIYFTNNRIMYWRNKPMLRLYIQLKSFIVFIGVTSFVLFLLKELHVSRTVLYVSVLIFFVSRIIAGYLIFRILIILRRRGKNIRRILILGAGRTGYKLYRSLHENTDLGFEIIGYLDDNRKVEGILKDKILGKIYDLDNLLKSRRKIDEIIIALPINREDEIKYALQTADYYGIRIRLIPDYYQILDRNYTDGAIGDLPTINIREVPLDDFINAFLKRSFDIIFSGIILTLISPLYAIIGLLIKLDSKGRVFYKPIRIGKDGKHFKLYKFRTMYENDNDKNGIQSTTANDPRITHVGKFLRKYSLDELPQFFNVLKGDMSVVGPRPHRVWLNESMRQDVSGYMTRHYLNPGITGWAQINGWRGPTDTTEKKVQRTNHDLWYMENWSLMLDIKIIFLTIFGRKAYENAF